MYGVVIVLGLITLICYSCEVQLRTEAGVFLAKQAMKALIQLSTSEHAQMETRQDLAKFQEEG